MMSKVFVVQGRETGSGFVVDNYLVTCKHVVVSRQKKVKDNGEEYEILNDDPIDTVEFFSYSNFDITSRLTASNPRILAELDLVIYEYNHLHLPKDECKFKQGNSDEINIRDSVTAVGFHNYKSGNKADFVDLKITSIEKNKYGTKEFNLDRPLYGGMSGGPVINNKNEVVGVIARGVKLRELNKYDYTSVFLPVGEINKIIKHVE